MATEQNCEAAVLISVYVDANDQLKRHQRFSIALMQEKEEDAIW